jgi:phage gp36-like protein
MPYTSPDQVRAVLSPDGTSADPSTAASFPDVVLQVSCGQAEDDIDTKLGGRYYDNTGDQVFPDPCPNIIADIATDIAAYLATVQLREGMAIPVTDPVYQRWMRAVGILDDLGTGKRAVFIAGQEPASVMDTVAHVNPGPLFSPADYGIGFRPYPRGGWG